MAMEVDRENSAARDAVHFAKERDDLLVLEVMSEKRRDAEIE